MGWANCGTDSEGRPIGYAHEAVCDHPSCNAEIDRGLDNACGQMHGEDVYECEKYFCDNHRYGIETEYGECMRICKSCYDLLILDMDDKVVGDREGGGIYVKTIH